ncbi:PIN domain-containing protein [Bacillus pseudomycoides]|uniref:PIN domain-containing protein n=1 Tax=Bacillus pseudomycoides TaxID=64104 RepID=UPI002FFF3BF7
MADKTALILDTCVWCNFLQNRDWDFTIFRNLSQLVKEDEVILFVPEQVAIEWDRNYQSILDRLVSSTESNITQAQRLADLLPEYEQESYLGHLKNAEYEIRTKLQTRNMVMPMLIGDLIKEFSVSIHIQSAEIKELILDFGLNGKKPFTKAKNSTGDAVIFFSIYDYFKQREDHAYKDIYFVTTNPDDFSQSKNGAEQNIIHEHLRPYADEIGLKYSTNIARTINNIHNNMIEKAVEDGIDEDLKYKYAVDPNCPKCTAKMNSFYAPHPTAPMGIEAWTHECFKCGHKIYSKREKDVSGM